MLKERPPPLHVVLEVARMAALRSYDVLDADLAPAFSALVQEAAHCMARPMAAISFVDADRIWFGATFGMALRSMRREGSFCGHAITQSGPLVVHNASMDTRFRGHPDVQGESGLRFYAGVSLEDEDGYRLGTICTFDLAPGNAEPRALTDLAGLASRATAALAAQRLLLAQHSSPALIQGWLGVRTTPVDQLQTGAKPGLIVVSVAPDSPARRAGLRPTDILVAIDGQALRHPPDVTNALANRPLDGLMRLHLLRGGHALERILPVEAGPRSPTPRHGK